MKTLKSTVLLALALMLVLPSMAAPSPQVDENIYNYLQLLRSDFNSAKVDLINKIMKLSAEEAKKFWPIYQEYEAGLGKLAMGRAELVLDFVNSHKNGTFDNAKAKDLAKRWFSSQRARLDLLEKYHRKIEEALNSIRAGQFLQIENQLGIFIDLTIASEMPLVGQ
jgi:hypothetical protein